MSFSFILTSPQTTWPDHGPHSRYRHGARVVVVVVQAAVVVVVVDLGCHKKVCKLNINQLFLKMHGFKTVF